MLSHIHKTIHLVMAASAVADTDFVQLDKYIDKYVDL